MLGHVSYFGQEKNHAGTNQLVIILVIRDWCIRKQTKSDKSNSLETLVDSIILLLKQIIFNAKFIQTFVVLVDNKTCQNIE